jgi:hypothetical protein
VGATSRAGRARDVRSSQVQRVAYAPPPVIMPLTRSLKPAKLPPHTHLERSPNSKMWGKRYAVVTMCPHIRSKQRGGDGRQCGLQRDFCMCLCPKCSSPLRARKQCRNCRWGSDRSPDASSPEESPQEPQIPKPRPWFRPVPEPRRGPAVSHPRGSLHLSDRRTVAVNPPPAHIVSPRPKRVVPAEARPVTWHRTAFATMPKTLSVPPARIDTLDSVSPSRR